MNLIFFDLNLNWFKIFRLKDYVNVRIAPILFLQKAPIFDHKSHEWRTVHTSHEKFLTSIFTTSDLISLRIKLYAEFVGYFLAN